MSLHLFSPQRRRGRRVTQRKNLIRRAQSNIKSFFEQRHTTKLRVREVNGPERLRGFASRLSPHESGSRTDHRVSPPHHVQPLNQPANVSVRALEIAQRHFSPPIPTSLQQ